MSVEKSLNMRRFSVPTNFQDEFLNRILKLHKKYLKSRAVELYGAMPNQVIGSGRSSKDLPDVDIEGLRRHIEMMHKNNIKFNYLLNAPCVGNLEYTSSGRKNIFQFLQTLFELKIDIVTITIPYLIKIIKKNFPNLKINTSTICYIDTLDKALFYQDLGVDRITLHPDINRDFKILKKIRKNIKLELELLVNSWCLLRCPQTYYHHSISGHFSQNSDNIYFWGDYCFKKCTAIRLKNPEEFIKSPFIRPEDIKIYEDLGIELFKIAGREYAVSSEFILNRIDAYLSGLYSGNLAHLFQFYIKSKLKKPLNYYIDNKALNNFIKFFQDKDEPCYKGCETCNYCNDIAKKVIKFDLKLQEEYIKLFENDIKNNFFIAEKVLPSKFFGKSFENIFSALINILLLLYWKFHKFYFKKERKRFKIR